MVGMWIIGNFASKLVRMRFAAGLDERNFLFFSEFMSGDDSELRVGSNPTDWANPKDTCHAFVYPPI
jgi:hypothetical protein